MLGAGPLRKAGALVAAALISLPAMALAQMLEPVRAPGGEAHPIGASGVYACTVGDARAVAFKVESFDDGQYRIVETPSAGPAADVYRYPWQLATATLYRERITSGGAAKFRRINGSLRRLQELAPADDIVADYAEVALDGRAQTLEWRYEIIIGKPAASFAPSGLGEVKVVPITELRRRNVDAQGAPLPLAGSTGGFTREEAADVVYAPSLGLPLRIARKVDGQTVQACSLAQFQPG